MKIFKVRDDEKRMTPFLVRGKSRRTVKKRYPEAKYTILSEMVWKDGKLSEKSR